MARQTGGGTKAYNLIWINSEYQDHLYINGEEVKVFENTQTLQEYEDEYLSITYQGYSKVTIVTKKACRLEKGYYDGQDYAANTTVVNQGNVASGYATLFLFYN